MAWLMAVTLMMTGATSMASSLRLEEPSAFAGRWQATLTGHNDTPETRLLQDKPSNTCVVDLAPNKTLGEGADCLGAWLSEAPIGWFPEPDGIAITGKEGSKIAFFQPPGGWLLHKQVEFAIAYLARTRRALSGGWVVARS